MFFRRFLIGVIFLLGLSSLGPGCSKQTPPPPVVAASMDNQDKSIVPDPRGAPNPKVQNGDIFDKAILKAADIKTLIVPENAKVEQSGTEGAVELYVKKTQSFGGHPPEPMTLESARKHMGCATKVEDGKVTLATYGEFSTKEGGSEMKLFLRVPAGLVVEKRPNLSGPNSAGQRKQEGGYLTKEPDARDGYWYGPASAGAGWKAIPLEPDPKRTAK
jgi:hypothetical protein